MNDRPALATLLAIRKALWYDYLSGFYTYTFICDLYETILKVKGQVQKEETP